MADPYPIRPVTEDEYPAFRAVDEHAFATGPLREAELALRLRTFEPPRSLAAFDPALGAGAGPVGIAGAYTFQMSVPGGLLPTAGVSHVAVLPTYRRRGILRSLMRRQLTDIAARGVEPIAALWASESPLYWRYGYGRATTAATLRFRRGEGALSPIAPVDSALRIRIAEPAAAVAELAKVHDTALYQQPGFWTRSDAWWQRFLSDPEDRDGFSPRRCVIAEDDSGPRGFALYRTKDRWDDASFLPDSTLDVSELVATDPAAGAALWRDLLSRDLVTEVTARLRPSDDPVLFQLLDPRRARPQLHDGVWARIIDLPAALSRRRYSCPVDVVLEVADELLPANAGRWRLRADAPGGSDAGITCDRTSEPADIALDIRELGAAYLGGTRLGTLAAAGLVAERRPRTLGRLSAAMSWDPAPWCPRIF
jgi:predicted acetyltransferase